MCATALVILADGFEELETVAPVDVLRRGGVDVLLTSAGDDLAVRGRNGIILQADCPLDAVKGQSFDLLLLPGGPAVAELRKDTRILDRVKAQAHEKKLIGAICAAPLILLDADVLGEQPYTAHFSTENELPASTGQAMEANKAIVTSRGAGTALLFGLVLLKQLTSKQTADDVAKAIMLE
jgi:4-methyl-5(b-hydroxyethyl)-thiazole monophosphate biosynthesis